MVANKGSEGERSRSQEGPKNSYWTKIEVLELGKLDYVVGFVILKGFGPFNN